MYEYQTIFPVKLSSVSEEEILEDLEECIFKEIGDKDAAFIPFEHIITALPSKVAEEYESGIRKGVIPEEYNAVIVYDEDKLKDDFSEHVKYGSNANPPRTQEEINEIYLNLVSKTFLHERIHLL